MRFFKKSKQVLSGTGVAKCVATGHDYDEEFLDLRIEVKVLSGEDETTAHISARGNGHSDAMVIELETTAVKFMTDVDAVGVFHNV